MESTVVEVLILEELEEVIVGDGIVAFFPREMDWGRVGRGVVWRSGGRGRVGGRCSRLNGWRRG